MIKKSESNWKKTLDNILIYNLYILIIGSILLGVGFTLSVNGYYYFYNFFQRLWYPIFIPSLKKSTLRFRNGLVMIAVLQ